MGSILRRLLALVAVGLLGASSVASRVSDDPKARVAATTSTVPQSTIASSSTTATTAPAKGAVTIAFGGDVHFEGVLRSKLDADPDHVLDAIAPVLSAADLAMVNLETAITERWIAQPKQYTFRAPATAFRALRGGGIDVATMANNHGMDFGTVGLADSLAAIHASGFPVVGIGADAAQAYAPYRVTVHGERVAIIGATDVIDGALISSWTATATHAGLASAKNVDALTAVVRAARRA